MLIIPLPNTCQHTLSFILSKYQQGELHHHQRLLLQQSSPCGQLFYTLYCFTIFIHNQLLTTNPLTDDESAFVAAAAAALLCVLRCFSARPGLPLAAGRNLSCSWLRRGVMDHCSDVSAGTTELSHRAEPAACSRSERLRCLLPPRSN